MPRTRTTDERDRRTVTLYDDEALELMQGWWGSSSDPLYAIYSMGGQHEAWVFQDAIANIDDDLRRVLKVGRDQYQLGKGTFKKKEIDELRTIRDALEMALQDAAGNALDESRRRRPRASVGELGLQDPPSAKLKQEFDRLRRMGLSPTDATRLAKFRVSWIGHVGDVSWEDHGGGPVYFDDRYGVYRLAYVEPPYDEEDDHWHVYDVDLDARALADILDLDYESRQLPLEPSKFLKGMADSTGMDWEEIAEAVWSDDPMRLAFLTEEIAHYGGWENQLNADPVHLTYDEFVLRFGEEPSHRPGED